MSLEWEQVIVDSAAPADLGRWWCAALDWVVVNNDPNAFEIRPDMDRIPGLLFVHVPEAKTTKVRGNIGQTKCRCLVNGVVVSEADLKFALFDR